MLNKAQRFEPRIRASAPQRLLATAVLAGVLLAPTCALAVQTQPAPPISIDGSSTSVRGLERNNEAFVPMRGIFEKLGSKVTFVAPSTVVATKNGVTIAHMTIGSRKALVNSSTQELLAAPFMSGDQVMVPLRLISQAAGATVAYSSDPHRVQIRSHALTAAMPAAAAAAAAATNGAAVATTTAAAATDTQATQGGIPWWVWVLAALLILGLILAFMRRKHEPIITTRSSAHRNDPIIKTRR